MDAEQDAAVAGRTAARLGRHVEVALGPLELSSSQYRILAQLSHGAEASSALAAKLAVRPPSVTAVVDGLVQRGLVERHHGEQDRRTVSHTLTASGRELLERADAAVSGRLCEVAAELGDAVLAERALGGLVLWHQALDAHRARCAKERVARTASRS